MSISLIEKSKFEDISMNSEKDFSKDQLSTEMSISPNSSNEVGLFNSSEEVQLEDNFCSGEDLNPDQNDDHNEDDCTEDEDEDCTNTIKLSSLADVKSQGDINSTAPSQLEILDDQTSFPMDSILPCCVGNLRIKKLTWADFSGTPNYDLKWSAHAFWGINYTYTVQQKTAKNKRVTYVIKPEVNVWLKKKSWAKRHNAHLLNHEQGHYILGCFCALEFRKQAMSYPFTDNYRFEIPRLFDKILKEHIAKEKKYDKETNHRMNREKQTEWDNYMLTKMKEYQIYFQSLNTPLTKAKKATKIV